MLYRRKLDVFQFLLRRFAFRPRGFFTYDQLEGSRRLLNSVWECPYRVVKDTWEQSFRDVRAAYRPLAQPDLMWVAQTRWAQVWMVVRPSGEGTPYSIVGGWWVMSSATSSFQRLPVQFDIDGFFYSSFKLSVPSGQDVYIAVLQRFFSFRCEWSSESWPEELALLCCAICWPGQNSHR